MTATTTTRFLQVLFLLLNCAFQSGLAIECYRCLPKATPAYGNQSAVESCAQFDGSSRFRIDCPHSTFCMKRNFTLEFPDGRHAIVTERGCAHQSLSYRVLKKGQWHTVNDVNETLYEAGCQLEEQTDYASHKPPTLYCYCSSWLCNTATTSTNHLPLLLFLVLLFVSQNL